MGQPCIVAHTGALNGSPSSGPLSGPSLVELLNTSFTETYNARGSGAPTVVGATDMAPFVLDLANFTITKVRMFALKVNAGTIVVKVTSAKGTDQAVPVSKLWLWDAPFAGDEITAIKFVGTADLEFVIAGDVS